MKQMIIDALPLLWTAVLLPLLTLAGKQLVSWATAKAKGSKWETALAQLTDIVTHVVADAEVTLRPQFQEALKDGKLDDAEAAKLKAAVMKIILEKLSPELKNIIGAMAGPLLDTIVSGAIEQAVAAMKPSIPVVDTPEKADGVLSPQGVTSLTPAVPSIR